MSYKSKYLKYKIKYFNLLQNGGNYIKDEIINFFNESETKIIKIQNINKKLYDASNIKGLDEKDKTYKINNDVDVIMREATDDNDVVLIYFGFRV
jgi:hypothetical protein